MLPIRTHTITFEISGRHNNPQNLIGAALHCYKEGITDKEHLTKIPEYSDIEVHTHTPPVPKVGMGSLFRKNGDLYALVSRGPVGKRYVLTCIKDGCWSASGTVEGIVKTMLSSNSTWVLVKQAGSYCETEWTGEVKLEEVAL